ncbi:MAG: GyrI-like domain-containing protein [Coxiellaceae bacterium]|nr:GyrI-like domain-containing protein [Coxiellaceae bacterium]
MKHEKTHCNKMIFAGLTVRTNNKNEMNPSTGKIGPLVQQYWNEQIAKRILNRANSGLTYTAYTDYESNEHGDYTFFVGEAVLSDAPQSDFQILTIPAGKFQKFTTDAGKMPDNIIQTWQAIWAMDAKQLGGKRNYIADFEVYDDRALDPNNAIVDIYIGIQED